MQIQKLPLYINKTKIESQYTDSQSPEYDSKAIGPFQKFNDYGFFTLDSFLDDRSKFSLGRVSTFFADNHDQRILSQFNAYLSASGKGSDTLTKTLQERRFVPSYRPVVEAGFRLLNPTNIFEKTRDQLRFLKSISEYISEKELAVFSEMSIKRLSNGKFADSVFAIFKIVDYVREKISPKDFILVSSQAIEGVTKNSINIDQDVLSIFNKAISNGLKNDSKEDFVVIASYAIKNLRDKYSIKRVVGKLKQFVEPNELLQITKKAIEKEYSSSSIDKHHISTLINHNSSKESKQILNNFKREKEREREQAYFSKNSSSSRRSSNACVIS